MPRRNAQVTQGWLDRPAGRSETIADPEEATRTITDAYSPSKVVVRGPVRDFGMQLSLAKLPGLNLGHTRFDTDDHRIGGELERTSLATAFCPPEFTLGELRQVYEAVWDTGLDPANFRRKVLGTPGFVTPVAGASQLTGGRGKPAALYRAGGAVALHPPLTRA